ncbi:hypothetical protein GCM10010430_25950 [Kitasatospora cystarginea]|uniref:Uncharacterized protein n=2 Tax=Kitasatospora TaxID=2063 RepID=A0ABN3DWJ4_9ACTN
MPADELQAEYREVAERRRRGLPDPIASMVAYVLSSGCIAGLATLLLVSARRH